MNMVVVCGANVWCSVFGSAGTSHFQAFDGSIDLAQLSYNVISYA
jgi:hypothetical protein